MADDQRNRRWWRHPVFVLSSSYLVGAIPFSNLMAQRAAGVDLREVGTRTVSGSGLYEVAGFRALAPAGLADVAKGALGPALAGADRPGLAAAAAGLAVAGHNWSPYLRGAGGRGVSPALGALAVHNWPGTVLVLAGFGIGRLVHQSGLGCFAAYVALLPVLGATRGRAGALTAAAVLVPLFAKRLLGNERPADPSAATYAARLVFDRDRWRLEAPAP